MTKNRFPQHVQETEGDLEFFMLLKGNFFQNVTFFARIREKLLKTNIFFYQKVTDLHLLCHLM